MLALGAGLVAWLAERHDAGEPLPVHDTIRISENRWRALRHGLAGSLLDLDSGEPQPDARPRARADRRASRPPRSASAAPRRSSTRARSRRATAPSASARSPPSTARSGVVEMLAEALPAMRANVGTPTSDRRRYAKSPESGTLRGMSVAEEPLDLLADYRREPRGYDEAVDERGPVRAPRTRGALRALAGRDLEALAAAVDAPGRRRGRLSSTPRSATRRS